MFSSRTKRAYIRIYYAASVTAGNSLLIQLEQALAAAGAALPNGQAIASTAANDHSVSFSTPGTTSPGPAGMLELIEELIRRHDATQAELIADGIPSPTDLQIRNGMLDDIKAVRRLQSDFSYLQK